MVGKTYAMELVNEMISNTESMLHRAELCYEDTPYNWADTIRSLIENTLAILDDDYKVEDVSYNGRTLERFLLIKRGFGEKGAQIHYEKLEYETTMNFRTIIDGKHRSLVVTLEDNETKGFLDYFDRVNDLRITTLPCEL